MCGFDLNDNKKNMNVGELLGLGAISSACLFRGVDCSGLDMLNVKMMQTGHV